MNCCVVPRVIEGFAGVTAIETSAPVTVSAVEPVILPLALVIVAVIVEMPVVTPVARPAWVIVATPGVDELHAAVLVRFCVLPSL